MLVYNILAGSTDVSVVCRAVDSADGTPETAFDHATSGIDLKYRREAAANVDITEAALAALTTAHTDGGVEQIGNGYFRLDLPDAAVAAGVPGVLVHGVATGMVIVGCYINLTPVPVDVRQLLGTAWIAPGTAGTPDVNTKLLGGTAQTGRDVGTSVLLSNGTGTGQLKLASGYVAMTWADIAAPTTTVNFSGTTIKTATDVETDTAVIGALGAGLTAIPWNAAWDAEVQSEATDALNAYDPPTNTEMEARTLVSAGYASPTNITAGTITTVTNLTNAPTAGDLTATMKTSVTTAATAATPTAAAVTGNIGGNVVGTVASVVGAVGSVTGLTAANLDATISSRMATYTQPTGFLAASFPTDPADQSLIIAATNTILADTNAILIDTAEIGAAGAGLTALATQASVNDLPTNAELATALGTADDVVLAQVALVKAKTDPLTFTVANVLDVNIQRVNDVVVNGDGGATPWGP